MSDAFGRALQAIAGDGDAAFLFSQGDFSSLDEDDLSDREKDLIQAAAEDADEVTGFELSPDTPLDRGPDGYLTITMTNVRSERFREALDYYQYKLKN